MIILGTNSIKDTGFDVANSLRFDTQSSENLKYTPSTYSSATTGTFSWWIKRGLLSSEGSTVIWSNTYTNDNNRTYISINDNDYLGTSVQSDGNALNTYTNMRLRDTSAWYHCVIRYNSTEGTTANRVKIWVNGVEQTSLSSSAGTPSGSITPFQTSLSNAHGWNFIYNSSSGLQNAYLSQCAYCDGQAYSASDFGEYDADSGIWKPKDLSSLTFGNNGYLLDYEDSSALGNDVSGNNNDFTPSGFSADNLVTDTPTNNFATLNPLDNYYFNSTFSEGNLKVVTNSGNYAVNTSTFWLGGGKWYWEVKVVTSSTNDMIGIANAVSTSTSNYLGANGNGYAYRNAGDVFNTGGSAMSGFGSGTLATYGNGDILMIAMDLDNSKLYFGKNGTWGNSGNPESGATGTGAVSIVAVGSTPNGAYTPALSEWHNAASLTAEINFGSPSFSISSGNNDANGHGNFEYAVPSGYFALCTKNLAEYG